MNCASGCRERLNRSDIDKWTENLNQLLSSEMGKNKFTKFLSDRSLDEAEKTVRFWEMCDKTQKKIQNKSGIQAVPRNEIIKDLTKIVNYADDYINFVPIQMEDLNQVLREREFNKIYDTLSRAKSSATSLLEQEHKIFSDILLKEYKLSLNNKEQES